MAKTASSPYLNRQTVSEPEIREIIDSGFWRDYQPDGSFKLRRLSDNALLDDLDQFGNLVSKVA